MSRDLCKCEFCAATIRRDIQGDYYDTAMPDTDEKSSSPWYCPGQGKFVLHRHAPLQAIEDTDGNS